MDSVDFFDRHLDPPDPPTYADCHQCEDRYLVDDLTQIGDDWYCEECLDNPIVQTLLGNVENLKRELSQLRLINAAEIDRLTALANDLFGLLNVHGTPLNNSVPLATFTKIMRDAEAILKGGVQ